MSLRIKVLGGTDLFPDNHKIDKIFQICFEISTVYGNFTHTSYSTSSIANNAANESFIELEKEEFIFESIKIEHTLQIKLIILKNYTTGYGISPQMIGMLTIPIERLSTNMVMYIRIF